MARPYGTTDLPVETLPVFRVTHYLVEFSGETYDLTLDQPLSANYFVLLYGTANTTSDVGPREYACRVSRDPFGTGGLDASGGNNVLTLRRDNAPTVPWKGTVTVVECLRSEGTDGFKLKDAMVVDITSFVGPGVQESIFTFPLPVTSRAVPIGGPGGGGVSCAATGLDRNPSTYVRLQFPNPNELRVRRWGGSPNVLEQINLTVYVVEWGSNWTVQSANVLTDGSPVGGAGLDNPSEFQTATITSVVRARTWLFPTSIGPGVNPQTATRLATLGDGVNENAIESTVAVGQWASSEIEATIFVLTHSLASVDWQRRAFDSSLNPQTHAAPWPIRAEGYRYSATPWITRGARFYTLSNATNTTTNGAIPEVQGWAWYPDEDSLDLFRPDDNAATEWTYWLASVDLGRIVSTATATDAPGPMQYVIVPDLEMDGSSISTASSENGYRIGPVIPDADNEGRLFPFHSGDPVAAPSLVYRVARQGDLEEASWIWQEDGASNWYGWNAYDFLFGVHLVNEDVTTSYGMAACYSRVWDRVIVGFFASSATTTYTLRYYSQDGDPYTSTSLGTKTLTGAETGENAIARMLELDDGSLRLLVLIDDPDTTSRWDWDLYASRDGGSTWTRIVHRLVWSLEGSALGVRPASAAFAASGDWLRLVWTNTSGEVHTAVSWSRGARWDYQGTGTTTITVGSNGESWDPHPLALAGRTDGAGTFILWVRDQTNNYEADAYTATRDEEWVLDTDLGWSAGSATEIVRMDATTGPDGIVLGYFADRASATAKISLGMRIYSVDDPQNDVKDLGTTAIDTWGTLNYRLVRMNLVDAGRELVLVSGLLDWAGTTWEEGIVFGRLAGWSTVPVQGTASSGSVPTAHWASPWGLPQSGSYSQMPLFQSGGTVTWALTGTQLQTSSAGQYAYWEHAVISANWKDEGMAFGGMLKVHSSATHTSDRNVGVRVQVMTGGGASGTSFMVTATSTMLALWDTTGSPDTQIGYIATAAITQSFYEFRGGLIDNNEVFLAARKFGDVASWKERGDGWTKISGTLALSPSITMDSIQWGHLEYSGSGSNDSTWREFWFTPSSSSSENCLMRTLDSWADLRGRACVPRPQRLYSGIEVYWGGGGGAMGDTFTGEIALTHGKEQIFVESPRFYWEATGDGEESVTFDFGDGKRSLHEAIALFGTRAKTATVAYNHENAWTAPLYTYEANATLLDGIRVRATDGNALLLEYAGDSQAPIPASLVGQYVRITAASCSLAQGLTFRVTKHGHATGKEGWVYVTAEAQTLLPNALGIQAGDTAEVYADRMAVRYGEEMRTRWMRITFPAETTAEGKHALGAVVAGPVLDFDPPLDWTWKDNEQPNTTSYSSKSGIRWAHREGPAQRVFQGRLVGDVTERNRESFRNLLRVFASYDVRPVALVVDHLNLPEQLLYGYISTGGGLDHEGWFKDDNGKWRGAGDGSVQLVEVV